MPPGTWPPRRWPWPSTSAPSASSTPRSSAMRGCSPTPRNRPARCGRSDTGPLWIMVGGRWSVVSEKRSPSARGGRWSGTRPVFTDHRPPTTDHWSEAQPSDRRSGMSPLGVVVLIVLVDLLGFSVVMPLLAPFAKHYGFREWQIGLLFSAYPMCQLVAGPILGRLSDRYGRRPLLIFRQAGTAISFLILGLSRAFWVMLLARMLDGASGGNILVAQAYVADVTKPEHRARGMGLIGMAFGLGFVLGPLLGGLLLKLPLPDDW